MKILSKIFLLISFFIPLYFLIPHILGFLKFSNANIESTLIIISLNISIISYFITLFFIKIIAPVNEAGGLIGHDVHKKNRPLIPESLGIVSGLVYIVSVCVIQLIIALLGDLKGIHGSQKEILRLFTENNSGLFCSCFMLLIGFMDDVLDLRWRYKIVLPGLAVLPILVSYRGSSSILIPKFLFPFFNSNIIELGIFYRVYMLLVAIFCSNSINIYAGVNGLEASQSFIIGISIVIHNLIEFSNPNNSISIQKYHFFSLICLLPFLGTTFGLLRYNWYPSQVFVGDTFTYFSGMTLAINGILGHFSKTLMLFFIPQWINFFISIPQLFKLVDCPRHRMPFYNEKIDKLEDSKNWTLINLFLRIFGPMNEEILTLALTIFQALCCAFGFYVRYTYLESVFK